MNKQTSPIRLILVDDHHVVRRGLRSYLEAFTDIQIVGEVATGEALLPLVETQMPDVVLMDLLLPGGITGIETTAQLRTCFPRIQVVVLTAYTDDARVIAALRAGAIGYVRKDATPETLLMAVRNAAQGQSLLDPTIAGSVLQELVHHSQFNDQLTARETEVLTQVAHGRTNHEIAQQLYIGEETVKSHVGNILAKLHLAHRTQAAIYALKQGVVALDEVEL